MTKTKDRQTPAFPNRIDHGMNLRDYFAAKAMQGWLSSFGEQTPFPQPDHCEEIAAKSYILADAMMEARAK